jgi:hypothetical protein
MLVIFKRFYNTVIWNAVNYGKWLRQFLKDIFSRKVPN